MTRSDNPFGDLPEWKERQRLQEAQARGDVHPGHYPEQPQDASHAPVPAHQLPQAEPTVSYSGGYENGAQQYASPPASAAYQGGAPDPGAAPSHLHYNVPQHPANEQQYLQPHSPERHYDPQTQVTYPTAPNPQYPANHQDSTPAVQAYGSEHVGQPDANGYGLRDGHYDDRGQFGAAHGNYAHTEAGQAPAGYDLNSYSPGQAYDGQQGSGVGQAPVYQEPVTGQPDQWNGGQQANAVVPAHGQLQADAGYDEDDDEYYDDEDDDEQRYSWKLLAAIVVTGAVVTGGGVVLYDSVVGGGSSGDTPIVRADQNPAKTAPANPGGRQFANRDSKLLGRLDTAAGGKSTKRLPGDSDTSNRVRSVPTVKIGRDGRLILPEEPKTVAPTAPESSSATQTAAVGGQRIAPGINVVDTLNGSSRSSLGATLPPVRPEAAEPTATPQMPKVITRNAVPSVQASNASKPAAAAPAAAPTKRSTNLATAPRSGPPPVPSKSAVGSAWRMTSAGAAAKSQPRVGGIRPTIARPIQPLIQPSAPIRSAKPRSVAPAAPPTSSTGGGGYVAVLATAATRMKALQSFAELQQKHPSALQGRVPDVQKADLSARGLGIMYRVVVGPPGPRGAANTVCSSLRSAGYSGCWVKSN